MSNLTPLSLLTFPPMIDSEMCRLLMTHYKIPYRETPHIFGWASILALWYAQTPQIPVLYGKEYRVAGPRGLVDRFEKQSSVEERLVPADRESANQVEQDWDRFNGTLASSTAVIAYYHLLPHRDIMVEPFSRGVPASEAYAMSHAYSFIAGLFKLLLRLSEQHAQDALAQVRAIFDETDKRLADGRMFLVGDALTLSDLSLAVAAAPVLLPTGYSSPIPKFEQMPRDMAEIIVELRGHETARFVQRIYDRYSSN